MTHFLRDILRQPEELRRTIEHLTGLAGAGQRALEAATAAIRGARHVYLMGIGSSWHAALNVSALFHPKDEKRKQTGGFTYTMLFYRPEGGRNMKKLDKAAERVAEIVLEHMTTLPPEKAKAMREEIRRLAAKSFQLRED